MGNYTAKYSEALIEEILSLLLPLQSPLHHANTYGDGSRYERAKRFEIVNQISLRLQRQRHRLQYQPFVFCAIMDPMTNNDELLRMALVGYRAEAEKVDAKIAEIEAKLGGKRMSGTANTSTSTATATKRTRRPMTAASRKRIAAAQKARWAAYHQQESGTKGAAKKATVKAAPAKRKLSPAAKAKLAANLAKARAARAAKREEARSAI
ncbi:MAG TPA: hypothetical protein VN736_01255 [Candidatus Limnocylindrales bacterium]|nr:hypothetical protein [Candidatus Limnocylindrales bacterium]